jgi:hypothetical protein
MLNVLVQCCGGRAGGGVCASFRGNPWRRWAGCGLKALAPVVPCGTNREAACPASVTVSSSAARRVASCAASYCPCCSRCPHPPKTQCQWSMAGVFVHRIMVSLLTKAYQESRVTEQYPVTCIFSSIYSNGDRFQPGHPGNASDQLESIGNALVHDPSDGLWSRHGSRRHLTGSQGLWILHMIKWEGYK